MTYNAFGLEAGDYSSARAQLMWRGLHPRDERFAFAERALQAAKPSHRHAALQRFGCVPRPVPVPTGNGYGDYDAYVEQTPVIQASNVALADVIADLEPGATSTPRFWSGVLPALHAKLIDGGMDTRGFVVLASLLPGQSGAPEIICLPQAFVMAVSVHSNHRAAAVEWLTPYADTWLRDWLETWPAFALVFIEARRSFGDLPNWLT